MTTENTVNSNLLQVDAANTNINAIEEPLDEPVDELLPGESAESVDSVDIFVSSPSSIVANGTDEVTVTYVNNGDTDAIAPLLSLEAEGALLRANDDAEFDETQIQFLGISNEGQAGVLAPGETNSFTVEFVTDGTTEAGANFSASSIDSDEVIDWESLRATSRPDFITPEAWDNIYDNFLTEVGTTAGDYQQLLVGNANYLSDLGDYEANVDDLLAFEFQQASDYQAIAQRNSLGSFGRGRTFIGDIELTVDDEGNVAIDNTGTRRTFDLLPDDTYQGQTGDFATVSLDDGVYTLTEADGTATVFNSDGQIDFIRDPNGNRLNAEYTDSQLTELSDSFDNSLTFEYNDDNRIVSVTDSDGRTSTYEYDADGELLESVTDEAGTTTYTYDGVALASITDPNGTTIKFTYDDRGRLTQQSVSGEDDATEVLNYSYGEAGEVTVTDADGNETELLLNENGQVGQLTDANGRLIDFSYDNQGNLTQIIAPENNSTLFGYDNRGNLTSQVDAEGNITEFTYEDTFNQLTGFTDANGNGINYEYDESGNLTTIEYEDGSSETFTYDENGDVTISENRRGQEIVYGYNDRGQIVSQINSDVRGITIDYTYDDRGNLETVKDARGTIELEYDESDRLTKITYPGDRFLEYTYDEGDRRTSLTDQDGNTVNYAYDDAGRLSSLTDGEDELIVSYEYDEVGRLAKEDKGNGTYTEYSYDLAGQLLSIENYAPEDTLNSSSVYTYDALGRQSSLSTLNGEWTYGYDATGQLTSADFASTNDDIPNQSLTYEYDGAGNRITTTGNGESVDYKTNNLNQYTDVNGFEYQYDNDGNLISKTTDEGTFFYRYNSENQLIAVTSPDDTVTIYEYDPFGNRIASVVDGERTEYLVDPFGFGDVVAEYDEDGDLIASYTHGLGLESITNPADSFYYDFNATGSTVGLTDADGGVANSYFYDPFGADIAETETVVNPFEFVGQFGVAEEANGLDFMRARFYDSDTGRFVQEDPIGLNGGNTNYYQYVDNNPINKLDPIGLSGYTFWQLREYAPTIENSVNNSLDTIAAPFNSAGEQLFKAGKIAISEEFLEQLSVSAGLNAAALTAAATYTAPGAASGPGAIAPATFLSAAAIFSAIDVSSQTLKTYLYSDNTIYDYSKIPLNIVVGEILPPGVYAPDLASLLLDPIVNREPLADSETLIVDTSINKDNEISKAPDNQARSYGEPHLTTFDGVGYDFQGTGDFTLVESEDGDLNVQVRYVQLGNNITVASAVATEVDGQNVVIDSEGVEFVEDPNDPDNLIPVVGRESGGEATVSIDGEEVEIASGGSLDVGDSRIFRSSGGEYTIVYAGENGTLEDGDDQLVVNYYRPGIITTVDVYLGDEQQGNITGLLGDLNGNPDDDIALRDGTVLARPLEFDRLYGEYRDDYRITDIDESLFTYEDGQDPDTFYNPNFPEEPFGYDDLTPEQRAIGDAAALEAGFEPGTFEFESASFDFAITLDPAFLEGSATSPEADGVDIIDSDNDDGEIVGEGTASISGIKFNDLNSNGVRDGADSDVVTEPTLSGVTIYLDLNNNGALDNEEPSQLTNENGEYSFTGLEADTYIVREVIPENSEQTFPLRSISAGDGYADTILEYFAEENAPAPLIEPYGSTGGIPPASPFNGDGTYIVESVEPEVVLGAPPPSPIIGSNPEVDWLALPQDSYVTVGFTDEIIVDGEGDDIFIRSFDSEDSANENADVFVSSDGINFEFLGTVNERGLVSLDLADIDFNEPVTAVRVQGLDNRGASPGFDLVSVEVLPNSIASPDFYTIELEESEVFEGANFGNTVSEPVETPDDSEQDSLTGIEIQLQAFLPNLETPASEAVTATIGEGFEFEALPLIGTSGATLVDVNIDITIEDEEMGSIFFEVDANETFTRFASAEFNGYVFTDISDQIPAIENVTIDESTNTLGLEASDVTFTENTIEVNVESLQFSPGLTALVNVDFADV